LESHYPREPRYHVNPQPQGPPGTVKCTVRGNQGTVKFTIPRRPGNVSQGKRKANTQAKPFSFHSTEFSSRAGD